MGGLEGCLRVGWRRWPQALCALWTAGRPLHRAAGSSDERLGPDPTRRRPGRPGAQRRPGRARPPAPTARPSAGAWGCSCSYHSAMLLCALITDVSMSMGWYRMPRSSRVSSKDPTTYSASWCSAESTHFGALTSQGSKSALPDAQLRLSP